MPPVSDHPLRYATVNELHARPFPALELPCTAVVMAFKEPHDAAGRDRAADLAHLIDLVDRHGGSHPQPEATHYSGEIGRGTLKWESHTEFVSYSAFTPGVSPRAFDPAESGVFPEDWLEAAPGQRIASLLIRVETMPSSLGEIFARVEDWFVPESLALSRVVDGAAVIAGDFRIDAAGHTRFAVFVRPGTGRRRIGRIVQRLCEIEIYRAMSMLGLARARALSAELNRLDPRLSNLVSGLDSPGETGPDPEAALDELLSISSALERQAVRASFRFGATQAYEAILTQRISVLREERIDGRQTFGEFMMRRYDPAMRTVKSSEVRLKALSERAERAAELLRTRVDVDRSAQNQRLLESMDRRADLALRLQHTVEGLSVVAISYYAVSLGAYALYPLAALAGVSKELLTAALVLPVLGLVWAGLRRVRKSFH
ncbi:DUF3422 family protein [Pseudogemmobacter faecipullorum]|uniref:DUF3422 domain-containing protein n=1 Tax=Pseudogemmobacter faecipullorum TaxID=2755041 RepID=A0ABS8CIE7_9RHOB|nr:DUF3422 domain-containing protein [Pseudogemmobacter faecipullorum]MCB5409177.1 DUF3422 domain-containing protein [Pseudogemmobacter faecipullorum]